MTHEHTYSYFLLFAVSFRKRKKIIRPHHQNYPLSTVISITVPYPLLSSGLSFSRLDKVSYTCVPQCFPKHIHAV